MDLTMCRGDEIRTHDLCVPNAALYQLSHTPISNYFTTEERIVLIAQLKELESYRLLPARTVSLTILTSIG